MRKILLASSLALILSTVANAMPLLKIEGGVGVIPENISGSFGYKNTAVDVKDTLNLDGETSFYGWAKIEHPIPLIPNFKIEAHPTKFEGSGEVTQTFTFGDQTFSASSPIKTELQLNQYDLTAYWGVPFLGLLSLGTLGLLDLEVHFGLNLKYIDGYAMVEIEGTDTKEDTNFSIPLPMACGEVGVKVGPVKTEVEAKWIGYSGNQFLDATGKVTYSPFPLTFIGVGYKYQNIKIDDISDIYSDIKIKGPFVEAGLRF
ncbi:MAG: TIGR04219 family outer membrane beta-barrel protein [Desulfurobacteriaceae bacterium]